MKKKNFIALLLPFLTVAMFQSCFLFRFPEPEPVETPPTGENTLSLYTDGHLYYAKSSPHVMGTIKGMIVRSCDTVYSSIEEVFSNVRTDAQVSDFDEWLTLELYLPESFQRVGNYTTGHGWYDICRMHEPAIVIERKNGLDGTYWDYFYYTKPGSGEIRITYVSPDGKIIKGTFEGTLYREDNDQISMEVENGQFHINLETIREAY